MTGIDRLVSRAGDGTPALSPSGAIPPARTGEAGVPAAAAMAPGRGRDRRRYAAPGKWCNGDSTVVEIVTDSGGTSRGVIVRWTGPGECVLDNGASGLLAETHQRRAARTKS